jgi:hypothetical protein
MLFMACLAMSLRIISSTTYILRETDAYIHSLRVHRQVVDMFGCQLPVLAVRYACIDELVEDGRNGLLFDDAPGLAAKVLARLYYQCVYEWHASLPGHVRTCACLLTPCHRQMLIFLSRTVMHMMMLLVPLLVLQACSASPGIACGLWLQLEINAPA